MSGIDQKPGYLVVLGFGSVAGILLYAIMDPAGTGKLEWQAAKSATFIGLLILIVLVWIGYVVLT